MDYKEAINYIHSTLWRGSRLGLVRMRELAVGLSLPQKGMKFIHIAGTNGKGSTAAMLSNILTRSGYKTGLFTSPYVTKFTERIQICGEPIPEDDLAYETACVKPFAEKMQDKPTEFELVTAIALSYFRRKECDIIILEVGMGGALDSTNVIGVPELAIITSIGLDHTQQLGSTIKEIALTKAGIIKSGGMVIAYGSEDSVEDVISSVCKEKGADLSWTDFDRIAFKGQMGLFQVFDYGEYKNLELSLLGSYQVRNAALVLGAVSILRQRSWDITDHAVREGLKTVSWPGRFELLSSSPIFLLDGAHNPSGTAAAAHSLRTMYPDKKFIFLTGVMADKDIESLFAPLLDIAEYFITVTPDNPRSLPAHELALTLRSMGTKAVDCRSIEEGINTAMDMAGADGAICAIGSLYMAGKIRSCVN